jgi:hypothetical protein
MSTFQRAVSPLDRPAHKRSPAIDRFWAKVELEGSCWAWKGHVMPTGYGQFGDDKKLYYAHRWSYQHFIGPIPGGLHLDHLCRNRRCVKPYHLEPVTQAENNQRSWDSRQPRRFCVHGHDTFEAGRDPKGYCRECSRQKSRQMRAAKKETPR